MKRRNTASKQQVLNTLKSYGSAMSHDMITSEITGFDRATIYRVLNRFCDDGIVHRIVGDDGKQYFALCINCAEKKHKHNHFHFRCTQCGKVECLQGEIKVSLPADYALHNFNGVVSGLCSRCT